MTALVVQGDARRLPLPDASVDLIVTSPPYFGLRAYTDGGVRYDGQIGNEPTPREYLDNLVDCTREWIRVLKPAGSIFVVLGDKYSDRADGGPSSAQTWREDRAEALPPGRSSTAMAPRKSRLLLPERYRIRCVDELGLIARSVIVWAKPSALPESVTDRVRNAHEDIVHLTMRERYYSAVDEIRDPHTDLATLARHRPQGRGTQKAAAARACLPGGAMRDSNSGVGFHPLGKLPGSVWTIASQPLVLPAHLGVDHFAAFPPALVRRIVLGWSPPGICTACGQGRLPVVERTPMVWRESPTIAGRTNGSRRPASGTMIHPPEARITGYACGCPTPDAPTRPALVVDPFGGVGTTAMVASVHGRIGVSVDLSHDYGRAARWRTTDPGERARAADLPKPPPQTTGQLDLLGDTA